MAEPQIMTEPSDHQYTGKFCWHEIEDVAVPFILRSSGEMMAEINMLKKTIFKKYLEILNESVFNIACPPETHMSRVTVSERNLLHEINAVHCDHYFSKKPYTMDTYLLTKDQVIKLQQVLEIFYKVVTERTLKHPKCGYIRIDESNTPVPFVDVDGLGMVVPLFFFECPAVMPIKIELEDHWSLAYLKLFCKLLSVRDVFYSNPTLMVIKLDCLKDVIPEAGQITFIETLPLNAKPWEITKYTKPEKRKCSKDTGEKTSHNTKRPANKVDNSTAEVIILSESEPDNNYDSSRNALETITIQIENDEGTSSTRSIVQKRKRVRKRRKMLPLLPKTSSAADTNSKQSNSKPSKSLTKAVLTNQQIELNSISVPCRREMEVKQSKQIRQKGDHTKTSSIDNTVNDQGTSNTNGAPVETVSYMDPNTMPVIPAKVNTVTSGYQDTAMKPIQIPDPSLLPTFQTSVTQAGNTSLEQNSLISNTMLLPSLSNSDPSCTPCFGFLPQAPGIMSNDFLQANPPLVLSGANNPMYVIAPQSELIGGPASTSGLFLATGPPVQPIVPPAFQKPDQTHPIIGTQNQPIAGQQAAAAPPSINVGISNSIVILQQQGQSVESQQQLLSSSITESVGNIVHQVGSLLPQGSNVSQQNRFFPATGESEIAVQTKLYSPKDSPTLTNIKPKESIEEMSSKQESKSYNGQDEFIAVFEKKPQNQFWLLKSSAREFEYKINKIPEYLSFNRPLSYRIQKFKTRHASSKFVCISSSPFETGNFLINILEVREKLFRHVEKTLFMITAFNMKLELFYLNSSQKIVFAKRCKRSKREKPEEDLFVFLHQFSKVYRLMSNYFKMAYRVNV